tara:strand:- start:1921 stop:2520 length:600 start_codon:yes stop_codon:yes gene_type:complete
MDYQNNNFFETYNSFDLTKIDESNIYNYLFKFKQISRNIVRIRYQIPIDDIMHKNYKNIYLYALFMYFFTGNRKQFFILHNSKYFISKPAIEFLFEAFKYLYRTYHMNTYLQNQWKIYLNFYSIFHKLNKSYTESERLNNYYKCINYKCLHYKIIKKNLLYPKIYYDLLIMGESSTFKNKIDEMLKESTILVDLNNKNY